jgi:hypothetical protein
MQYSAFGSRLPALNAQVVDLVLELQQSLKPAPPSISRGIAEDDIKSSIRELTPRHPVQA